MNRIQLVLRFTIIGLVGGTILGAALGMLFQFLFLGFAWFGLLGAFFGLRTGALLGIVNGIAIGIVTTFFFYPPNNKRLYLVIVLLLTSCITFVGSFLSLYPVLYSVTQKSFIATELTVIATVIATLAAIWMGRKLAIWHLTNHDLVTEVEESIGT